MQVILVAALVLVLQFWASSAQLQVSVKTNPPGPSYPAATWITFECVVGGGTGPIVYEWNAMCWQNGSSYPLESNDSTSMLTKPILSTQTKCFDAVTCIATDTSTNEYDLGVANFGMVTGIGLTHDNEPVSSGSVIVADMNGSFGIVRCHSGSRQVGGGYWVLPDSSQLTESNSLYHMERNKNDTFTFISLEVAENSTLAVEGQYICVLPDENGQEQRISVWIYFYEYDGKASLLLHHQQQKISSYQMTLLLVCVFNSTLGTVSWDSNSQPITTGSQFSINTTFIEQASVYVTELTINATSTSELKGVVSCHLQSVQRVQMDGSVNIVSTRGSYHFIVDDIGKSTIVPCPLQDESITDIWVMVDGQALSSSSTGNKTFVSFVPLTDADHGRNYSCQGNSTSGIKYYNFTMVALVPPFPLSVEIPVPLVTRSGQQTSLDCKITKEVAGFTQELNVKWIGPKNDYLHQDTYIKVQPLRSTGELTLVSSVIIPVLNTSLAGMYTCIAIQPTITMEFPLQHSAEEILPVLISSPGVVLEVYPSSATLFTGGIVRFQCTSSVPLEVDIDFSVIFNWYAYDRDGENLTTIVQSEHIYSNDSAISQHTYSSVLTMTPASLTLTGSNNLTCGSLIYPDGAYHYVVISDEGFDNIMFDLLDPVVAVSVIPKDFTGLDISPAKPFSCFADIPAVMANVSIMIEFEGVTLQESIAVVSEPTTIFVSYFIYGLPAGMYIYRCLAVLYIFGEQPREYDTYLEVVIKGTSPPFAPVSVSIISITAQAVTISWLVPALSYDSESYSIHIGQEGTSTIYSTEAVKGIDDFLAKNQSYTAMLSGLQPNTTYHFMVVAMNSNGSTASSTLFFTTPPPPLSVDVVRDALSVAGSPFTLTCIVAVPPEMITVVWLSPDGNEITNSSQISVHGPVTQEMNTTLIVEFSPMLTSHAGDYDCSIELHNKETFFVTESIAVQIPKPEIQVNISENSSHGVFIGHNVTLSCLAVVDPSVDTDVTVSFSWKLDGLVVSPTARMIISEKEQPTNGVYLSELQVIEIDHEFEGSYQCSIEVLPVNSSKLILPVESSAEEVVTVQDLPEHEVTVSTQGTETAGESFSLFCSVTTADPLLGPPLVEWLDSNGFIITSNTSSTILLEEPVKMGNTSDLYVHFPELRLSHAGVYICRGTSFLPEIGLTKQTSRQHILKTKIPLPQTTVTKDPPHHDEYFAGSHLNLVCSITFISAVDLPVVLIVHWLKDAVTVTETSRIIPHSPVPVGSHHYQAVLEFTTLSEAIDSGEYRVHVTMTAKTLPNITNIIQSSDESIAKTEISIQAPWMMLELTPEMVAILDVPPYNTFVLTCSVTTPLAVISSKIIIWKAAGFMEMKVVEDSLESKITTYPVGNGTSISTLRVAESEAGMHDYYCESQLNIIEDSSHISAHNKTAVFVKGQAPPVPITSLEASKSQSITSATISWIVPKLAYTEETYTVIYNLDSQPPGDAFVIVEGDPDIYRMNVSYSIDLGNLEVGETYYYQVVSNNTIGLTTHSVVKSFVAGFQSNLFQLKLLGINDCLEWVFSNFEKKTDDIKAGVTDAIKEECHCSLLTSNIHDEEFVCVKDPEQVVFRARIYGTLEIPNPSVFVQYLQQWIGEGKKSFTVGSIRLNVDQNCPVAIYSFSDPECTETDESSGQSTTDMSPSSNEPSMDTTISTATEDNVATLTYAIIASVIGVLLFIGCVVLLIIFLVCLMNKQANKRHQQQETRMKELFEVASSAPMSPRTHLYIRNDCMPTSRASMFDFKTHTTVPTPHYMSPRSSIAKGHAHSMDGLHRPDSAHIYYQSSPGLPVQPYLQSEPIYEPIPGQISPISSFGEELNFETFRPGPAMPERNKQVNRRRVHTKKRDGPGVGDTDDYMEMSPIGHVEITPSLSELQKVENGNVS